ncbi:MAG TPA: DciA family protein [Thermoanaerobaculia bacterium]
MRKSVGSSFTRLDATADGLLRRMAQGEDALLWIRARWGRIVGEPLVRKVEPQSLEGRRLVLRLLDDAWRQPVTATLPELEAKLAAELPRIQPRVVLAGNRESGTGNRKTGKL